MSRRGALLFAAMSIIWGLPYLLIRVAVRDLSPATLVAARTLIGALLLLPFAARPAILRPLLAHWRPLLLYTAAEVTVPWLLLSRAEQHLTSSFTGLLVAAAPLIAVLLGRLVGTESAIDGRRMGGLWVGLLGVAALLGLDTSQIDFAAVGEMAIVATGYALGPIVLSRRLSGLSSIGVTWIALTITALIYLPFARMPQHVSGKTVASVVTLGIVCTALAFLIFFALILDVGPSRALVITYLNPVVALLLGVTILNEQVSTGMLVGFPLVLLGSFLATRRDREPAIAAAT
jgi:drug/metabolite transporter (DMT)-like permease